MMQTHMITSIGRAWRPCLFRTLFVIKCTLILIVLTIVQGHATSYAQKITLQTKNASLKQVLYQISKQTGYNFISDGNIQAKLKPITLDVKDMPMHEVLTQCIGENILEIVYEDDQTILIREKK